MMRGACLLALVWGACAAPQPKPTTSTGSRAAGVLLDGGRLSLDDGAVALIGPDDEGGMSFERALADANATVRDQAWTSRLSGDSVRRVVLRADLTRDAAAGFKVEVARVPAASNHFRIDFDGTIYQTADLNRALAHADGDPQGTVGIVLNNELRDLERRPDALPYRADHPRAAEVARHPRQRSEARVINGVRVRSWGYTAAQYRALATLLRALGRRFPAILAGPVRDADGLVPHGHLPDWRARDGVLADWHVNPRRWGPGPAFAWDRVDAALGR